MATEPLLSSVGRVEETEEQYFDPANAVSDVSDDSESDCYLEEVAPGLHFLATSPAMKQVRADAILIAQTDVPIFLLGESGVGKEVVALLIHKHSGRSSQPFLKVNCAALPSELLESELFGFEAGAFTGAVRSKPGKFELCHGGTILLDEIAEMPPFLQAKLLHVLQDGRFSRLGGKAMIQVDVRVLAATNIDVARALAQGSFREDLYYRLSAFTLSLPPLRERREEIPLLLRHFLKQYADGFRRPLPPLSRVLLDRATEYEWPGNLRELENFAKRYLILGEEAAVRGLYGRAVTPPPALSQSDATGLKSLVRNLKQVVEMKAIAEALEQTHWNRVHAARMLRISYKALLYKIRQFNLDAGRSRLAPV